MQCHAWPGYIEREKKKEMKTKKETKQMPRKTSTLRYAREDQREETNYPEREARWIRNKVVPPPADMRQAIQQTNEVVNLEYYILRSIIYTINRIDVPGSCGVLLMFGARIISVRSFLFLARYQLLLSRAPTNSAGRRNSTRVDEGRSSTEQFSL